VLSKKDSRDFFVNGVHRLNGIFIAHGDGVRSNSVPKSLSIMDLFPTALYWFGLEIPRAIDGRVITEIFHEDYLIRNPAKYGDYDIQRYPEQEKTRKTYETEEESKEIEEALKGLGYID